MNNCIGRKYNQSRSTYESGARPLKLSLTAGRHGHMQSRYMYGTVFHAICIWRLFSQRYWQQQFYTQPNHTSSLCIVLLTDVNNQPNKALFYKCNSISYHVSLPTHRRYNNTIEQTPYWENSYDLLYCWTLNLVRSLRLVRTQKSFSDFNEIWYVNRGRWVMHDGMPYDPIQGQGQGHE